MFKITTKFTVFQLKNMSGVMPVLSRMGVYIRHTQMKTVKSRVIVTLYMSHSFFTGREEVMKEIWERIFEKTGAESPPFLLTLYYQTHLPPISYTGIGKTIKQDTILVEEETKNVDGVLDFFCSV